MPYTQSTLQSELSKQREASAGWPWRLVTLSFVIVLTVGAVYIGMRFGFEEVYLKRALSNADAAFAKTSGSVSDDEQKQILGFYSQLSNIGTLLKKQGKSSPYLDMIEKNTLKAVMYTNMDMKTDERTVTIKMDGKTPSYVAVVEQMELYKKLPNVKEVKLSGARTGLQAADGIMFSLQVTLNRQ
jgi:hypothetical protein